MYSFVNGEGRCSCARGSETIDDAERARQIAGEVSSLIREGETIAGKYRIDRVIGVGGMGMVMAAHHLELDDRVAIKFLLPETASNSEAVERFAREGRAAVRIKNEHVARIIDVDKLDDGTPYLVMEYLEGSDLAAWLIQHGPLPVEQAVEFVLQAGEAIAEAHSLGIVHRDLKPSNLFVTQRPDGAPWIKVLDFGISKMLTLSGSGASMTKSAVMVGSPMYMSPQQIRSARDVNVQGDVWALGVILYELLAGVPPFDGENLEELVSRIIAEAPPSIRAHRPEVSEALEAVIFRCLERDLERRFASIAELARALLPFAPRHALASVQRISGTRVTAPIQHLPAPLLAPLDAVHAGAPAAAPASLAEPRPVGAQTSRDRARNRLGLGVAIVGLAALALFVALRAVHSPPRADNPLASVTPHAVGSTAAASPAPPTPPAAPLVVTLGAALPARASTAASVRPQPAPPVLPRAVPTHIDPFNSDSWGKFRR